MKIVFLDAATLGETSLAPIAALGQLVTYPTSTPEEALQRVGDAEVLIVNKVRVDEALLEAAPALRLVCESATGVNNIDLDALARAISEGRIAGAAVDVYTREPIPEDHPLLHTAHPERLRLTPHAARASREALDRLVQGIADNISSMLFAAR